MKCPRCNFENQEGSAFCSKCGLQLPPPMQNQNHQQQQNMQMNQYQYGNPNFGYQMNMQNKLPKTPFYRKTWFIVLMCIFFLPVGIVFMWISAKPKNMVARIILTVFLSLYSIVWLVGTMADTNENNDADKKVIKNNTEEKQEEEDSRGELEEKVELLDVSQFQSATESIGMDYSKVKNVKSLDDWASGKRYSFVYDGFEYIVYELGNGEINTICAGWKRTPVYERGYKPLNYKDFEPDISIIESLQPDIFERLSQYIEGETSIKNKIGSMMYSRIYDYYSISGGVKAKNSVSKKDFTFTVDYIVKDGGYECVYLAIDGAVAFGSDQTPEIPKEKLTQVDNSGNGESIIISYDKEGECGQYDLFDGEPYLRYYVPAGSYKVKCNIRGGFYIETIELHKEDGWDTATTIQQINMSEGEEIDISIEGGQCISLIINTEIELEKK